MIDFRVANPDFYCKFKFNCYSIVSSFTEAKMEEKRNPRLSFLEYGAAMAFSASCRASCPRQTVGAALFDSHKIVTSTGCNGAPAGAPQCNDIVCLMVDEHCLRSIHSERTASVSAGNRDLRGGYAFITVRPCDNCFKVLVVLGIKYIYYLKEYRPETAGAQRAICQDKKVILEQLQFTPAQLFQKMIEFHQNPGGLFADKPNLKITSD